MNALKTTVVAFGIASFISADVVLPKIMSSKMVLQRGVAAPIWGWADQGEEVTVRFAGQVKKATPDAHGKWMLRLDPLEASKYGRVMTIQGTNTIQLDDILVGEVWLASGQSNMEWTFNGIDHAERDFAAEQKNNPLIRVFHVDQHVSSGIPLDDTVGRWKTCEDLFATPASSSAVGFFFALKLQQTLDVPVAYLDANWGGQRIECFIPDEGYAALELNMRRHAVPKDKKILADRLRQVGAAMERAAQSAEQGRLIPYTEERIYGWSENFIYNAMIAPLTPYAISGAIWYQGESNRGAKDYLKKVKALSVGWSQVFGVENIPLYQVQIAPFAYNRANPEDRTLADTIWAAQYQAAAEVPGVEVVPIHDVNINIHDIHPRNKRTVGERLAARALKSRYGKDVVATGPRVAAAVRNGNTVVVSFEDVDQGLATKDGQAPSWFELSGDDKGFVKAEAVIEGNQVKVSAAGVEAPAFVRMGWKDIAIPNLMDKNGWPVFSFDAQAVSVE